MGKILSYLYPITKKIKSEYSGVLEVTWYNGKKHLNTKNANYSYGSLQRILKIGLEKIQVKNLNNILLLGLGGGSVIQTLRNDFNYSKPITAVDIDPVIVEIAKTEFHISEDDQLKLVCQDALLFMKENSGSYDLIIVDLFIDTEVPEVFLKLPFWENVLKACPPKGIILFNASLEKTTSNNLVAVINFLKTRMYKVEVFEKVNDTNTLILAHGL